MKYVELKKHIESGEFMPAYYISGEDEYLRSWSLKMFKDKINIPQLNYTSLEKPEDYQIIDALSVFPMGDEYRFVFVDVMPVGSAAIENYFKSPQPSSVLITFGFAETRSAKTKAAMEALKKSFTEVDCSPLSMDMLKRWIAAEAKKQNAEVTNGGAELLIEYSKNNLMEISGEINKLALYRSGGVVTEDDVRALVRPNIEYTIWQLSDAVAAGNRREAMRIADKLEQDKMDFTLIFGTLYSFFRKLFYVSCSDENDVISGLDIKQYAYNRQVTAAKKYGMRKLKNILYALSDIDYASKSGRLDKSMATRTMISTIINLH